MSILSAPADFMSISSLLRLTIVSVSVLCLACGCALTHGGHSYYVATNGSDTNPGTKARPFKTVQQAVGALKPGDTVLIGEGRYPAFVVQNLHGTAEAPITFKSYRGEKAVIDRGLGGAEGVWTIHILGNCSYLVFEDLEVTDTDPLIDKLRALDIDKPDDLAEFLKHIEEIRYRDGVRINPPSKGEGHHHLTFRNLEVHHLIGLGFSGKGDDLQFINNHVYDLGRPRSGYGWYTSGDRHIYRGKRVHDCTFGFHLYGGPVSNTVVEDNVIYNCGLSPFYHMSSQKVNHGGSGLLLWAEGGSNVIRNNVLYANHTGINVDSPGLLVVNNTIYDSLKTGLFTFAEKKMILRNNIIYKSGSKDVEETAGNTFDHNLVGVDPLFVNAEAHDFHLRAGLPAVGAGLPAVGAGSPAIGAGSPAIGAGSPAIGAGVPIPGFDTDIEGTKRPQGKAWDIGAYEHAAP